jgi:hypothetical protein
MDLPRHHQRLQAQLAAEPQQPVEQRVAADVQQLLGPALRHARQPAAVTRRQHHHPHG